MSNLTIREVEGAVVFTVKIVPGSSRTAVCGLLEGKLKVKVSDPAEKGRANQSLVKFLAKQLGVKKKAVRIISGKTGPVKVVQVSGISVQKVLEKLNSNKRGSN